MNRAEIKKQREDLNLTYPADALDAAYNKGIDHCIEKVRELHNYIQSPVVDFVINQIIEDLKNLKESFLS